MTIVGVAFTLNFLTPSIRSFKTKSSISLLFIHFSKSRSKPSLTRNFWRFSFASFTELPLTHFCWLAYKLFKIAESPSFLHCETFEALKAATSNGKCLNSILAKPVSRYSSFNWGYTSLWKFAQWLQVKDSNAIIVIFASSLPTNILFISSALILEIVLKI